MRKAIFTFLLFVGTTCNAQVGIITMKKNELPYYSQWYVIDNKEFNNQLFYFDKEEMVDSLILELLKPWELTFDDSETDEDGDLFWTLDNDNGFTATLFKRSWDEEDAQIIILTSINE